MSRILTVGGAQMGPIARNDSRAVVVERMITLLDNAKRQGAKLSCSPKWH
jgi:hypothetical protein